MSACSLMICLVQFSLSSLMRKGLKSFYSSQFKHCLFILPKDDISLISHSSKSSTLQLLQTNQMPSNTLERIFLLIVLWIPSRRESLICQQNCVRKCFNYLEKYIYSIRKKSVLLEFVSLSIELTSKYSSFIFGGNRYLLELMQKATKNRIFQLIQKSWISETIYLCDYLGSSTSSPFSFIPIVLIVQ